MPQNRKRKRSVVRLTESKLNALVDEAIVDAYGEDEQRTGLFTMIENNLKLPFETVILGVPVIVKAVELEDAEILAICARGKKRQALPISNLPLPSPPPKGAEWIAAYREWVRGR